MISTIWKTKLDRLARGSSLGALLLKHTRKQKLRFEKLADVVRSMPEFIMQMGHIAFGF
jgi:hypothetical protein